MSLQSSALVLLAGMSTALVVVDAQNMLQSAMKKFHVVRAHHTTPRRMSVGCGSDDRTFPEHTNLTLWIG